MSSIEDSNPLDSSPIFDNLDIDLVVNVLSHTALSPFFIFFIPVFYFFQGAKLTDPIIIIPSIYYVLICCFWGLKWVSRLYRNQGSLFFRPERFDWGDQVVVVTGGASGLGELLANTLAIRNVNVAVLDINPIVTENYNITYYKCDVSKWEEVEAVAKQIIEEIGQPTVLVNNAGVVQGKSLVDMSPEDVKQTFGVNTFGHFWTLKAFLPGMIEKGCGHIVTVASIMGIVGAAKMTDYCASKAALISLNESLRYELDHHYNCPQIRTTLVLPGYMLTPLFSTITFPDRALLRFLAPSLHPIAIVKRIITALDEQHSQTIILPFYGQLLPYIQLAPSFVRDFFQWLAGADYVFRDFVKLSGRRPEEGPKPALEQNGKYE